MWQKIEDGNKYIDLAPGLRLIVWCDEGWWWRLEGRGEAGEDEVTILRSEALATEEATTTGALVAARLLGEMVVRNVGKVK